MSSLASVSFTHKHTRTHTREENKQNKTPELKGGELKEKKK